MKRLVFELKTTSALPCLEAVREFIGQVCRNLNLVDQVTYEIKNALDEIYINIVEHAYEGSSGLISIKCYLDNKKLSFVFRDWGRPYAFPKKRRIDLRRIVKEGFSRGLGLPMVYRLMDRVVYRPGQGSNEHILEKNILLAKEG